MKKIKMKRLFIFTLNGADRALRYAEKSELPSDFKPLIEYVRELIADVIEECK